MIPYKISIISVFPELHDAFTSTSLVGRAVKNGVVSFHLYKLSDVCRPGERIDEPTCGPGTGMVIKPEIIDRIFEKVETEQGKGVRIFFSPQGVPLTQPLVRKLGEVLFGYDTQSKSLGDLSTIKAAEDESAEGARLEESFHHSSAKGPGRHSSIEQRRHLILFCSRYEGIDERVWERYADLVLSIGDYVLMGGDVAAQVFIESILRMIPGVVGKQESVERESFSGPFLDHPTYGLPTEWHGMSIPEVVQSGNHAKIDAWRREAAAEKTVLSRFDWFVQNEPNRLEQERAQQFIPNHYVALMHTQINIKGGRVGETSVTSLDIHDIARSSATYGIENYFVVTPLQDQQKIVKTFLRFWHSKMGKEYNQSRYEAVERVELVSNLDDVVAHVRKVEKQEPLLIATSAKVHEHAVPIDYFSQSTVWAAQRPVVLLFGTGQGLSDEVLSRCDYLLGAVNGMTAYNHLSVRSATAIILDRWLGLHPKKVVEK